jgi:hypothetical protein
MARSTAPCDCLACQKHGPAYGTLHIAQAAFKPFFKAATEARKRFVNIIFELSFIILLYG